MTPVPDPDLAFLDPGDGRRIAIRSRAAADARSPTIVFLPGYASDMEGGKATSIDQFCASRGLGCLRLDYSGTGSSPGDFADGTIPRWLEEVLAAVDLGVPEGKVILAGSSMGGWIALLAALRRKDRVAGLLGIAAAPDFTDWGYSAEDKQAMVDGGKVERANPYGPEPSLTYRGFWESGAAHRLLHQPIDLIIPIRLVHGERDEEVPMGVPIRLMADLRSSD
ncbi:MAG: alpha/beta fold hydrolase, partial [Pseudomonadota bacterium]|nr:alpha/beta fold hydrolase [Pseudomonadota bacterium]